MFYMTKILLKSLVKIQDVKFTLNFLERNIVGIKNKELNDCKT